MGIDQDLDLLLSYVLRQPSYSKPLDLLVYPICNSSLENGIVITLSEEAARP